MIPLDTLLAPVSEAAPSGEDPSATGVLFELETAIQGKPETQFSAAEEPDWRALKERAIAVAGTTKDLRVGSILTATLLRTNGLTGLRDGVQLLRGYIEQFWPTVYPLLDTSDNNDPSERLNALSNIAAPVGSDGDLLRVIVGLRAVPLLSAPQVGQFTLNHYLHVKGVVPTWPAEAGAAPTSALLDAAKKEVPPAAVKEVADAAKALLDDLAAIEKFFKDNAGPSLFPSFEPLRRELKHVHTWLAVDEAAASAAAPAAGGVSAAAGGSGAAPLAGAGGVAIAGEVHSRADALRAIDAIIDYYQRAEPSSPVPFILVRVKRIVNMNFIQLITELTPEAMDKIIGVTGPVGDSNAPTAQ